MHLIEHARAKVNLSLRVLGKRPDGYHELDSLVRFADAADGLTLEPADAFTISAPGLDIAPGDNLMTRAATLFADRFGPQPYLIRLDKQLPVAAGLGGGSADAAAVLRLLARAFGTRAPDRMAEVDRAIRAMAPQIGSDVPACLLSRACRMRGRGELVDPLGDVTPMAAVLVNTRAPVPTDKTARIFRALAAPPFDPDCRIDESVAVNDLEAPARAMTPAVDTALAALGRCRGVTAARLSGAGPTCFGLFETAEAATSAANAIRTGNPTWWVRPTLLR